MRPNMFYRNTFERINFHSLSHLKINWFQLDCIAHTSSRSDFSRAHACSLDDQFEERSHLTVPI